MAGDLEMPVPAGGGAWGSGFAFDGPGLGKVCGVPAALPLA